MNNAPKNESLSAMLGLLQKVEAHLQSGTKADMRKAVTNLERIVALASTLSITIQTHR